MRWTAAKRAAFARKMARARMRARKKNPTKAQIRAAAARLARKAGSLAWRGTKLAGRAGRSGAKAAAAEVKASLCRPRAKNPKGSPWYEIYRGKKLFWTTATVADARFIARLLHAKFPRQKIRVVRV